MEIRRIEGILPVEGISRDLPLKLENFSYKDMKKLLSLISKGEGKGNPNSEFESLIKATFLDYLSKSRGRIKIGDLIINARIDTDKVFKPGEELLLRVKNIGDEIELSLISPLKMKLSEILRVNVNKIISSVIKFPRLSEEEIAVISQFVKNSMPEIFPEFKAFLSKNSVLSPYFLLTLLALLKEDIRSKIKNPPKKEEIIESINNLLSLYSLYVLSGILTIPVYIDENFKGKVLYLQDDISRAVINLSTSKGNFKAILQLIGKKISVEYSATGELAKNIKREDLENLLKKAGLEPVCISRTGEKRIESVVKTFLKGEGIALELNV